VFNNKLDTSVPFYHGSQDRLWEDFKIDKSVTPSEVTKTSTYFVLGGARATWTAFGRATVMTLVGQWSAAGDTLALGTTEVDFSAVDVGQTITVKWRGKPVFIRHRSEAEIADAQSTPLSELRQPQTDAERVKKPEWLVVIGICTHLGCVPIANAGDYGGWFCPCHGSHYDVSGRIRKGPAPENLWLPEYKFISDTKLVIG
jgi:ubiquinol-cytochrome c reductase iron-sulfur subunit